MNGPKVSNSLALVKPNHMRETPRTADLYSPLSEAVKIRRTWGQSAGKALDAPGNPQRLDVRDPQVKLESEWVTGFVDGEGCFHVGISVHADMAVGYQVLPEFTVVQHERDVQLLHALRSFFGCGVVRRNHGDRMCYRVRGREHLVRTIVPFFLKHPLKTQKRFDFEKFRRVLDMMEAGDHLNFDGLERIRHVAEQMNRCGSR